MVNSKNGLKTWQNDLKRLTDGENEFVVNGFANSREDMLAFMEKKAEQLERSNIA